MTPRIRIMFYFPLLVLVVFTSSARSHFPSIIDLADTTADVEVYGIYPGHHIGDAVASGDINGDGFLDLLISSCVATPLGGEREGEVYIIWGEALLTPSAIDLADPSCEISRIFGKKNDGPLFCQVTTGDFDNDDYDDIIIGKPLWPGPWGDGVAYVIFGEPQFPDTVDLGSNPPNVITIYGNSWGGWLGKGLCTCDMNGDGYDEIVVAAPALQYGEIYLIHGGESFQQAYYMEQEPPGVTRIIDHEKDRATGERMACKDVDKDGCDDLLIGARGFDMENTYDGRVTLLYGMPQLPDTILLSDDSFRMKRIFPEYSHGNLGGSVAIGDVNGDNKQDLIVSAYQGDPLGCSNCGEIYILYDANQLPDSLNVSSLDAPITRIMGGGAQHWAGLRLLSTDVTGNQFDDIVITSWGHYNKPWSRDILFVVYGNASLPDSIFLTTDTLLTRIYSANHGDHLGHGIASADFNLDNVNDLVAGADWAAPLGRGGAGIVYLFYGIQSVSGTLGVWLPRFVLMQNYPNPFSTSTTIEYFLPSSAPVTLTVYNILGQRVARIIEPMKPRGPHSIVWNGRDEKGKKVASGIYFYRLKAGAFSATKKMILLR